MSPFVSVCIVGGGVLYLCDRFAKISSISSASVLMLSIDSSREWSMTFRFGIGLWQLVLHWHVVLTMGLDLVGVSFLFLVITNEGTIDCCLVIVIMKSDPNIK